MAIMTKILTSVTKCILWSVELMKSYGLNTFIMHVSKGWNFNRASLSRTSPNALSAWDMKIHQNSSKPLIPFYDFWQNMEESAITKNKRINKKNRYRLAPLKHVQQPYGYLVYNLLTLEYGIIGNQTLSNFKYDNYGDPRLVNTGK